MFEDTVSYEIHNKLRELINLKSQRDGKDFSINKLAKAINMPHSMLVKLAHQDPSKRVINPRIDTLSKIVEFFKADGFSITLDDFIFGTNEIAINTTSVCSTAMCSIQIFALNNCHKNIGKIDISISKNPHHHLIAFISESEIEPFFKAGSIFIVDTNCSIRNENLVAVKMPEKPDVQIKKIIEINKNKIFFSLTGKEEIKFSPVLHHIIGVIVQVNAKT